MGGIDHLNTLKTQKLSFGKLSGKAWFKFDQECNAIRAAELLKTLGIKFEVFSNDKGVKFFAFNSYLDCKTATLFVRDNLVDVKNEPHWDDGRDENSIEVKQQLSEKLKYATYF